MFCDLPLSSTEVELRLSTGCIRVGHARTTGSASILLGRLADRTLSSYQTGLSVGGLLDGVRLSPDVVHHAMGVMHLSKHLFVVRLQLFVLSVKDFYLFGEDTADAGSYVRDLLFHRVHNLSA